VNAFDIALVVLCGALALVGLLRGLVRLLVGTAALVAAWVLAARYHVALAAQLDGLGLPEPAPRLLAYAAIFLATMLAGALVAWLARRLVRASMLGWADRLAGGAVGLVAAVLLAALVVLPLVAYSAPGARALRGSVLAPYVVAVAGLAGSLVPADLAERYRRGVEDLQRHWRERAAVEA
jgi:membrane protein required for colicin V production